MQGLQGLHILLDGNLPWRQHMSPVPGLRQLGERAAWSHCLCFVRSLVLLVRSCRHILRLECMPPVIWHCTDRKPCNIVRVRTGQDQQDQVRHGGGLDGDASQHQLPGVDRCDRPN